MNSARRNEQGAALIVSLIMMVLIAGLVVAYLTVSTSNLQLTANSYDTLQALNVAETGMAKAFHELNAGNTAAFIDVTTSRCPSHATTDGSMCNAAAEEVRNPDGDLIGYRFSCGHGWAIMPMVDAPGGVFMGMYNVPLTDSNGNYVYEGGDLRTQEVGMYGVIYLPLVPDQRVKLVSTGSYNYSQRAIEVIIKKRDPDDPPPFSRYALITDGPLSLAGNIGIYGDVHTNESVSVSGAAHTIDEATDAAGNPYYDDVDGDGVPDEVQLYTGILSASGTINGAADAGSVTGINATGVAPSAPEVPIPEFDTQKIIQAAIDAGYTVTEVSGDQSYTNTVLSGIIVVDGNVTITGNVTGDAILIATGDIFVAANATLGSDSTATNLMIWAGDDVTFHGNADIFGYVFASDVVNMSGTPSVTGAIIAKGEGDNGDDVGGDGLPMSFVRGTPDIYYRPPDADMTTFLNELDPPKWELLSWRECGFRGTNVDLTGQDGSIGDTGGTGGDTGGGDTGGGDTGGGDTGGETGGGAAGGTGGGSEGQAGWDSGKGGGGGKGG
ncbi:MAG: hypothetical protein AB1696_20605 [Planctomycetota bacterium]